MAYAGTRILSLPASTNTTVQFQHCQTNANMHIGFLQVQVALAVVCVSVIMLC